jgi:uncharacterized SAM-binding protein YcdF (DUF218 family)
MRWLRATFLVACALVAAGGLHVAVNIASVVIVGASRSTAPVDAIVVLGAAQYDGVPSPELASRLDRVVELWNQGRAPIVGVTGGKMDGDRFTEAATSRRYLTDRGVPADAIVAEDTGRSTWESLANIAPVLRARGVRTVVVVTNPYHLQRSVLSMRELGFDTVGDATGSDPLSTPVAVARTIREGVGVAVGRIIGFERLWRLTG